MFLTYRFANKFAITGANEFANTVTLNHLNFIF